LTHEPVMVAEVIEHLAPSRGGVFVDCTVGLGGHARAMAEAGASRIIGLDRDRQALVHAQETLRDVGAPVEVVHADYRAFDDVLNERGIGPIDGLLADLGVSSLQLDQPGRGFSFRRDEPLDMRMDTSTGANAADMLAAVDEKTLADVIYELGEERHARRVARSIVETRKTRRIETTGQLADIVRRAVPRKGYTRIDAATRTFQAIRIWVKRELEGLDGFLTRAAARLAPGGRLVMLTFHSLEDRVVKHTLRALQSAGTITIRTKRPMVPSEAEVDRNPRARSAKLRAAERVA
jgi:16S rRNA (cytosine1402-N4)-methyltransferase